MKTVFFSIFKMLFGILAIQDMRKQLSKCERVLHFLKIFFLSVGLLFHVGMVRADVWGYVDAKGVAHFASEKIDDRYELFFRGGTGFDTRDGLKNPQDASSEAASATAQMHSMPRNVAVPKNAPKLLAFFDVSPSFKAVKHHLREAANTHNIDIELLQALIATESGFDTGAVSPKGAVGLMQLMPPTAQRYGVQGDAKMSIAKKLTDPRTNIRAGSQYLRDLMNMFPGKLDLVLAAYNAGEGAVLRYGNQIPPYKETQNYVKTVMQIYAYLKPPAPVALKQAQGRQGELREPSRVRMQMPSDLVVPTGGAQGRGNMIAPLGAAGLSALPSVGTAQ